MILQPTEITAFRNVVWEYFATHRRAMPWRERLDPYTVMVSEIMLQQTQVDRVRPKYEAFIQRFPTVHALAHAPLSEVLALWSGLGYNRRAKFLHGAAKEVIERYNGKMPESQKELATLPGIGPNTAGAIIAYAFNEPVIFIETNIRSVLLHHFFQDAEKVNDVDLHEVAAQVLDTSRPREWYWALMDYGTFIKKTFGNNIARASSYRKQSKFEGSLRQVRGQVVALLVEAPRTAEEMAAIITDERLPQVLAGLQAEKLIIQSANRVQLAE